MSGAAPDLGAVFDEHVASEFAIEDLTATMATMMPEPSVNHVPTMIGGVGGAAVAEFYAKYFIGHRPKDTTITRVTRTVGQSQVVDEMIVSFTHDIVVPALLPGVAPTGVAVRLPVVAVV